MNSSTLALANISKTKFVTAKGLFLRLLALLLMATLAGPARAGSGRVNSDGTLDVTVNFRFPPSEADLTNVRNQVTQASQVLWDASEGQLRFGKVTLTCGSVNEDLADMWVLPQPGRAGTSFWTDGSGLGKRGLHVRQFLPSSTGTVIAHEFGHLALGLGDEYSEQSRFGACWGYGPCIDPANLSEQNQCLMQLPGGFTDSEFCTAGAHDMRVGDGISCATRPLPIGCAAANCCMVNCEYFNAATGLYETTQQTALSGRSCWEQLVGNFPFLKAPRGLPIAAAPGGFVNPSFTENCGATDTVMLMLDRSGSMNWNTENDNGEVCGDGIDNNGDGRIDESDCTPPRLEFVKAAARAWLELANNQNVRAGIVSFNGNATLDQLFQAVNGDTLAGLKGSVDALAAAGSTGIGNALLQTVSSFDAEATAQNKTAFLITDGVNTDGPEPETVVQGLRDRGIRVFTISTGGASDSSTLANISGTTSGAQVDSHSAMTLVNAFTRQWGRYRNIGTLIAQQPYDSRTNSLNAFTFEAVTNTSKVTLVLAGNMQAMSGFGPRVVLEGPPGIGASYIDSEFPMPNLRVVHDRYFLLVEILYPNQGPWTVSISPRPGADFSQTGNLTVLADQPDAKLFTSLDRYVVTDTSRPVKLFVSPIYRTALRNVDNLTASVKRPDGSVLPISLTSDFALGGGGDYVGEIADLAEGGLYKVTISMTTGTAAFNDPGESVFADSPPNTVDVPALNLTAEEYFFVVSPLRHISNKSADTSMLLDPGTATCWARGSLTSPGNWYAFRGTNGSRVWITVDTGGSTAPTPAARDSFLTLFNPDGTVLEADNDDGSGNGGDSTLESPLASAIAGRKLTQTGLHYIQVRPLTNTDASVEYKLFLTVTTSSPTSETESNNTSATANSMITTSSATALRSGTLSSTNDLDYFKIYATNGSTLQLSVDCDPERDGLSTSLVADLMSGTNVLFSSDTVSGPGNLSDPLARAFVYTVRATGTYYVRVRSVFGGTGTYHLMVSNKTPKAVPFQITSARCVSGEFQFTFPTATGNTYRVAQSASMLGGWTLLPGTITGTGGYETYALPMAADNSFIRIRKEP